ncbi:secretory phospholipase A2 receptor-like [Plectropomus leopardus]|uniref:secretory phospholipase A2 receptor-like n=1 Tax=Plectropomus leopardus TaxID=160734 RepID=UPI001C4B9E19|nr:secretory phospholipase A2 receptor-like [Plectropomus leopardus]
MDGIIHLVLLLYGLCPLSSCVPQRQYILVRMAKTWYEAQSFCREKCFDLATIHDMGEMETALTAVEDKHYDAAWIGLQKVPFKRWHWSLADKHFYKEGERNYFIWGWKTDDNCVFYKNGKLYSASCPTLRYSICFDGKEQGRDQYFLTTVRMSWTVARDYCRQFYTDLTSVRNDAEYQILQQVAGNQPVWVGLYRDHWEWSDRTYSSLRYWKASLSVYTKMKLFFFSPTVFLIFIKAMESIVHLLLLLSGLFPPSSCVRQYVLVNTPKSWYEAQSFCRESYVDLATIDDMGEMGAALTAIGEEYSKVWIGLQQGETQEWHWSLADKHFYKEGERNYLIWGETPTDNCGYFLEGKLYTSFCYNKRYSVCFDEKKDGREQYLLTANKMAWISARDYCRTNHTDLASMRNEMENQFIREVAGDLRVWLGVYRDPMVWSDRTYSSFRYWKAGKQPTISTTGEDCVVVVKHESDRWTEQPCNEAHPFLCYGPVMSLIKIRLSSEDLDLNDPTVPDDLLKQIKQLLSNTSVNDVSWKKQPDGQVFIKEPNRSG